MSSSNPNRLSNNRVSDIFYKAAIGIGLIGGAGMVIGIGGMGAGMVSMAVTDVLSPSTDICMGIMTVGFGGGICAMAFGGAVAGAGAIIETVWPGTPANANVPTPLRNTAHSKYDHNGPA